MVRVWCFIFPSSIVLLEFSACVHATSISSECSWDVFRSVPFDLGLRLGLADVTPVFYLYKRSVFSFRVGDCSCLPERKEVPFYRAEEAILATNLCRDYAVITVESIPLSFLCRCLLVFSDLHL